MLIIFFAVVFLFSFLKKKLNKNDEIDSMVNSNVTPPEEREEGDEPNTELTEEEMNKLDINPVRLRDFILDYSSQIAKACIPYINSFGFLDTKEDRKKKENYIHEVSKCIMAESIVALFSMCHFVFNKDLKDDEWGLIYSYVYRFWFNGYKNGLYSFDGYNRIDYDNLIDTRITIYTKILSSPYYSIGQALESYIDYHTQNLLYLLEESRVSIYEPHLSSNDNPNSKQNNADTLYQTIDLSMLRINNSSIESKIKNILNAWYRRFLNIQQG